MVARKNAKINSNHGGYYKTLYHYACNKNRKCNGRVCDFNHTYNQERVDAAIFEIVSNLKMHPIFKEMVLERLGGKDEEKQLESELKKVRRCLHMEEMKKRKLGEDMDNLDIMDDGYGVKYDRIQDQIDRAYDRIEEIESDIAVKIKKLSAARKGIQASDRIIWRSGRR